MNLTNVKLRLFKVTVGCISFSDALGVHIGSKDLKTDLPGKSVRFTMIDHLYVSGYSMHQVTKFLKFNRIYSTKIKEVSKLLDATKESE